jgi:hypothetical protein
MAQPVPTLYSDPEIRLDWNLDRILITGFGSSYLNLEDCIAKKSQTVECA